MSETAEKADVSAVYPPGGLYAKESITRDEARKLFADYLFDYSGVTGNDIYALEALIGIKLAENNEEEGSLQMHLAHRKNDAPKIKVGKNIGQTIESAFICVDGDYFKGREAISFNSDGFIGFAGWADDKNVQPFLRAFVLWVVEWLDR